MVPEATPRETLRSRGNKTHCFPRDQSSSVLCYPQLMIKTRIKTANKSLALRWLAHKFAAVSSTCCFSRELGVLTHGT